MNSYVGITARNTYKMLAWKREGKRPLGRVGCRLEEKKIGA
jgi:hypothetical protein